MFWTRLLSSVILTIVTVGLMITGGLPLLLALAVISIIGMNELYKVLGISRTGLAIVAYIFAAIYYAVLYFAASLTLIVPILILFVLALLALYVLTFPKYKADQAAKAAFGFLYVPFTLSFLFLTRLTTGGEYLVWLAFSAWACDVCAYCTGLLIGKHKMTPVLSPKKTIEGAIGGIVGTAGLGALYGLIFSEQLSGVFGSPVLACLIICAVCAPISMIGDLAASAIKRDYDIKDYGKLIPGHGGILDRFDSVIFTAPMVFIMLMLISALGI